MAARIAPPRPSAQLYAPNAFDMTEPNSDINRSGGSGRRGRPNACHMFRVNLHSNHALSTSAGNTWTFQLNAPEEFAQGRWMMAVDSLVMSGDAAAAANTNRVNDFYITGVPLRDNYECTPAQDSALLVSTVRGANTHTWARTVTKDTIGVQIADLGQLRQRRITITVRNGDGVPLTVAGLTHWRLGVVFYLFEGY